VTARRSERDDVAATMERLGRDARTAARSLVLASSDAKNAALKAAAAAVRAASSEILDANARDVAEAKSGGATSAFLDRLALDAKRVESIAKSVEDVSTLPDPVGQADKAWTQPNGLRFERVRVPLGVIGIIFESRPNVTADAGALCLKSGNAAILRAGSESFHSSSAIAACLAEGLRAAGLLEAAIQLVPTKDRAAVGAMLAMQGVIDVIVPRGGKSLIARVQAESRVPVIAHLDGLCHTYVDGTADLAMARQVTLNAKMRRTGVCGATETLLVDRRCAATHLKPILDDLTATGCEIRGCAETRALDPRARPASEADWSAEYLDAILSVRIVGGVEEAIDHIRRYGSQHTDAIVTEDKATAERFLQQIDSAIVLWNASTQFADGGEFGFGAEIGISTGKLHARGPVGAEHLTSWKYVVRGTGQTRP